MNTMTASIDLRRLTAVAILGAMASAFATVSTASDTAPRSVTVKYGDLNVSNPDGAAALYGRIARAAREVCESPVNRFIPNVSACMHKAIANAVAEVGHPQLIAVYNAKNGKPLPITLATR